MNSASSRKTLDSLMEGIQIINSDWRYVYLNDVMVDQARAERSELLGYTMMEKYPGIEHTEMFRALEKCMHERTTQRLENHFIYPDQTERWFDLKIEPAEEGICILSLDITDYKKTQERVVANEKRFRALIEKSADMKTMSTAEGRFIYGSPSITKVLGFTLEEMQDKVIFDLFHPDDVPGFLEKREKILAVPGSSFPFRLRARTKDGGWIWCEGNVTNFLDEPGINAMVSNFRDITEQKKAEQQREFDQNNLYALINNSSDLMGSVDLDLNLITSNKPFDESIRTLRGTTIGKGENVLEGTSQEIRSWLTENYYRAFSGELFTETVYNKKAGKWFQVSFHPILKASEVIGTACHSRDITEQKALERTLLRNNSELRKTNLELDRFVYSISHDLRSPLTSILGLVALIEDETHETETLEHAKMIRSGVNRLDGFIKNILSYSRNSRKGLAVEKIALRKTAEEIIRSLNSMKDADGIEFQIDFREKIPFYTDRQSLCTIIENLVSNAIKFRRSSIPDKYIRISGTTFKDFLELEISDNGIGIPAEYHEKIFEMFFRLSGRIEGSGIGLYIVREIVEKLQGTIDVSSQEGSGTTFKIKLKNLSP